MENINEKKENTVLTFIDWVQQPGVYDAAMQSCRDQFYRIFYGGV